MGKGHLLNMNSVRLGRKPSQLQIGRSRPALMASVRAGEIGKPLASGRDEWYDENKASREGIPRVDGGRG